MPQIEENMFYIGNMPGAYTIVYNKHTEKLTALCLIKSNQILIVISLDWID